MFAYCSGPVRAALLAVALACPFQWAEAGSADPPQPATARTTARTHGGTRGESTAADREGVPVGGVLIIVAIVAGVIFLAWVCARVADKDRPTIMM